MKSPEDIIDVYISTVMSVLQYAMVAWHASLSEEPLDIIEHIHHHALTITFADTLSYIDAIEKAMFEMLYARREAQCKSFFATTSCNPIHKLHYLLPDIRPPRPNK